MIRAALVLPAYADEIWPFVAPHIAAALKSGGGDYSAEDALASVKKGDWQLWIATQPGKLVAAALTEVVSFPRRKVLWCIAAGGSAAEGVPAILPLLKAHAAERGASEIRMLGRRGWARSGFLPGWKHQHDVLSLEV